MVAFKVKNSIETINVDDLLDFSKKHHNYFVLVRYLWGIDDASRYEFIEEHKYLLKEDSHFIQLYAKKPAANMTYETLLKYEKYYSDNFLYQCLCYDYADLE